MQIVGVYVHLPVYESGKLLTNDGTDLLWTDSPTIASLTLSSLTAGRVLFAGADGLITDDAGLTYASGTDTLTVGAAWIVGNFQFTSNFLAPTTSDGSDNSAVAIAGGGSVSTTRGAHIIYRGNENGAGSGDGLGNLELLAGNVGGSPGDGEIQFRTAAALRLVIDNPGDFDFQSGDITTLGDISGADITASDNFIASLGAVGTPSYTFTGLGDTGMYAPDANSLGFTINGSQVLVINPTETVIVGNLEPFDDNTLDLGHPGWRWRNLFLSDDASIGGDISCVDITASGTITDGTATILGGNILTTGTLGAGVTTITSTTQPQLSVKYDATHLTTLTTYSDGNCVFKGERIFEFSGQGGNGASFVLYDGVTQLAALAHDSVNNLFLNYVGNFLIETQAGGSYIGFTAPSRTYWTIGGTQIGSMGPNGLRLGDFTAATDRLEVVGITNLGDGGTTDYTQFTAGGSQTMVGTATVWNDMQFQISDAKVTPASLLPSWEAFTANTSEYAFGVDKEVDTSANEIPHSWKQGTAGSAHMHITTKAVPAQEQKARFTITFAYADTNEAWVEAPLTAELTIPISTTALTNFYLDLGDITLTNYLIEAQMRCRVKRIAKSAGGTEYVGDIFITQVGIHFEEDTIGSGTEMAK